MAKITLRKVFCTEDGKEFRTMEKAEQWGVYLDMVRYMEEKLDLVNGSMVKPEEAVSVILDMDFGPDDLQARYVALCGCQEKDGRKRAEQERLLSDGPPPTVCPCCMKPLELERIRIVRFPANKY